MPSKNEIRIDKHIIGDLANEPSASMEDFLNRFPVVDDEDIDLITVYLSLQGYLDNLRTQVFADHIIRNGGEFVGLEVSNKRGNLCCLFPDPQYPGHYRLSFHDQAGPVSHSVYSTAEQALKEAISLGYREHTPGQLDRLSEDPHWQFGLARVSETYSALRR